MKETYYRQCTYESPLPDGRGVTQSVSWLPEKYAVLGKSIYFGKKTKTPNKIWTVTSVGDIRQSEEYLKKHERDYKTQRQASDI